MKLKIIPKSMYELYPTDILFQTSYWGQVKNKLGWEASAFELSLPASEADVLVLTKRLDDGTSAAYIPQGPEYGPNPAFYGIFLERLSESISQHLESSAAFIRYDLPWFDPYALDDDAVPLSPPGLRRPENRLREIRMNFATDSWNLRKAPLDLTVADSLIVDITGSEDELLNRMKPKTRYNIRLSKRKGVRVIEANAASLPTFFDLYLQTAARNGFPSCEYRHFSALFETSISDCNAPKLSFYLAMRGRDVLAGVIMAVSKRRATYLFGASSNHYRYLMGSHAVQWHAMKEAKRQHCTSYDMGAVSPFSDRTHPFYGMYRFKTGFGGRIEHRVGTWDFPLHQKKYSNIRNNEMLRSALATQI
jgi:lipid II:glycine glycyltransferase (peptidoglycan interpeptide bridge formation enzyme)